ncbi:MAG TPA: hypothetical protein VHU81_06465 [Thermoanaerobaculia bacterium]|jgi:hypothetical protein|nr:hypothetical protein [Thermoanaerobaculia bacterium]
MPRTKNEYTAVAGAEKRLGDLLRAGGLFDPESVVRALTQGAEIEYKPRLKSLVITLRLPEPDETLADVRPWAEQPHPEGHGLGNDGLTDEERAEGIAPMFGAPEVVDTGDSDAWPEITQSGPDGTVLSLGFLPKDEPDAGYYPGEGDETDA